MILVKNLFQIFPAMTSGERLKICASVANKLTALYKADYNETFNNCVVAILDERLLIETKPHLLTAPDNPKTRGDYWRAVRAVVERSTRPQRVTVYGKRVLVSKTELQDAPADGSAFNPVPVFASIANDVLKHVNPVQYEILTFLFTEIANGRRAVVVDRNLILSRELINKASRRFNRSAEYIDNLLFQFCLKCRSFL